MFRGAGRFFRGFKICVFGSEISDMYKYNIFSNYIAIHHNLYIYMYTHCPIPWQEKEEKKINKLNVLKKPLNKCIRCFRAKGRLLLTLQPADSNYHWRTDQGQTAKMVSAQCQKRKRNTSKQGTSIEYYIVNHEKPKPYQAIQYIGGIQRDGAALRKKKPHTLPEQIKNV